MNKNFWIVIAIIVSLIGFIALLFIFSQKGTDWKPGWKANQKKPHGAYIFYKSLPALFPKSKIYNINNFFTKAGEMKMTERVNIIITPSFSGSYETHREVYNKISNGAIFFIASNTFQSLLLDTIGLQQSSVFPFTKNDEEAVRELKFKFKTFPFPNQEFTFHGAFSTGYFIESDTIHSIVHAVDEENNPILIERKIGEGSIFFCAFPYAFSNYYLLQPETRKFATGILTLLPDRDINWIETLRFSSVKGNSPFRFLWNSIPIRTAIIIAIIAVLLFILFKGKRLQRVIPIHTPHRNATLDFVYSIGVLYFNQGDHYDILKKQFQLWKDNLWLQCKIQLNPEVDESIRAMALKSGVDYEVLQDICRTYKLFTPQNVNAKSVLMFHKKIHTYYSSKQSK